MFLVSDNKDARLKGAYFTFFFFLLSKRALFRREKNYAKSMEKTYRNWFSKFRSDDFDVKNASRSGRPVEVDEGTK